jgi:protocatechuate 3,4-dioxygenase beta subunit
MGRFQFRTILPVPYPGRTPHIHMKILDASRGMLTTQLYLKEHPSNERDFLFKALNDLEREMNSLKLTRNSGGVHSKFSSSVRIVV